MDTTQESLILATRREAHDYAKWLANKVKLGHFEDDCESIADLGLCRAANHYTPDRGVWQKYWPSVVKQAMYDAARDESNESGGRGFKYIEGGKKPPASIPLSDIDHDPGEASADYWWNLEYHDLCESLIRKLHEPLHRPVMRSYLLDAGCGTLIAAAGKVGCSMRRALAAKKEMAWIMTYMGGS